MTILFGLVVVIVAGIAAGIFAVPMKRMVKWEWENQWIMWALWALIVCSWGLALATVPDLIGVYREAPQGVVLKTFLFGVGGGIGMVTFGLGIYLVGFSLGFPIILGATALTGSLIPMLVLAPETFMTAAGGMVLLGLVAMIAGVLLFGSAGILREKSLQGVKHEKNTHSRSFVFGFIVCIISAVFNSMVNLFFTFGAPIAQIARTHINGSGVDFCVTNSVLAIGMSGAFVANFLYCGWLLMRRKTWKLFWSTGTGSYWFWTLGMAVVWIGAFALYGWGTIVIGKLGTTVGWIVYYAVTVLTGNAMGLLSGEWKDAPAPALKRMVLGIVVLLVAISFVGYGGYLSK